VLLPTDAAADLRWPDHPVQLRLYHHDDDSHDHDHDIDDRNADYHHDDLRLHRDVHVELDRWTVPR
jgi:hypothetical protein